MSPQRKGAAPPEGATGSLVRALEVLNEQGVHARPAAMFVRTASKYDAEVVVEKDGFQVSGKSIMGLMTLEASMGTTLRITATGPEAAAVLDELERLFASNFSDETTAT